MRGDGSPPTTVHRRVQRNDHGSHRFGQEAGGEPVTRGLPVFGVCDGKLTSHLICHGRTAFEDAAASGRDRLLLRLWLSMPNSRALPEDHSGAGLTLPPVGRRSPGSSSGWFRP